jgi:hypothetical protein
VNAQAEWSDDQVLERAEIAGRTVEDLCQLLRSGGDYQDVSDQIARVQGALEDIRFAAWQREATRAAEDRRRGEGSDPSSGPRRAQGERE